MKRIEREREREREREITIFLCVEIIHRMREKMTNLQ